MDTVPYLYRTDAAASTLLTNKVPAKEKRTESDALFAAAAEKQFGKEKKNRDF